MDAIITRIKEHVFIINPALETEDEAQTALLDLTIEEVVDRAVSYTNRADYIEAYEEALEELAEGEELERHVILPIPPQLEIALARIVTEVIKTNEYNATQSVGAITNIKDHGQEISYSDKLTSFLSSSDDQTLFSSINPLLRKYMLPKVNGHTRRFQNGYWR